MPDLWMDVDTALAEVPVNILPLIDDTDFKSVEEAIAYNAAGMDLIWHFTKCDGTTYVTPVTPTTGGNYDWAHQDGGMYTIEMPASGGASANNDTEGFGWFTGRCTGVLPWRGPTIGFRRAALNDLLVEGSTASTNLEDFFDGTGYAGGTAKLEVDVAKWLGTAAHAADEAGTPCVEVVRWAGEDVAAPGINGTPAVDVVAIHGTALTETAGQLAGAFKKFFDVAAPTATCLSLPDAVPGAAGGVAIAGSNAATTFATLSVTGQLDAGNLLVDGTTVLTGVVTATAANDIHGVEATVGPVTLANGAHGGAATVITLQTPIVANTTQIEGGDATDALNAATPASVQNIPVDGSLTVALRNGAHGGAAATVALKSVTVTNSDGGGTAVGLVANAAGGKALVISGTAADTEGDITGTLSALDAAYDAAKTAAQAGDSMALTVGERNSVAAALLDLANGIEAGYTMRQALRLIAAAVAGKTSGYPGGPGVFRNLSDTADRISATNDADGNRTAMTLTP